MIGRNVILVPVRSTGAHRTRQERPPIFARIVTATLLERWRTPPAYHACLAEEWSGFCAIQPTRKQPKTIPTQRSQFALLSRFLAPFPKAMRAKKEHRLNRRRGGHP